MADNDNTNVDESVLGGADGKQPDPNAAAKTDGKDGKAPDSKADGKDAKGAVEYKDFTFPEGVEVDATNLTEFKAVAKELGLSQEQAQKLVDTHQKMATRAGESQAKAWEGTVKGWKDASAADKEFGGQNFKANVAVAKKALDTYGTPELREFLNLSGAGNHPEVIRFMHRVGKTLKEDSVQGGSKSADVKVDPAKVLFPNMA